MFYDEMAVEFYDEANSDIEERYIIIGVSSKTRELFICHCYRDGGEIVRIISARRANKKEIKIYKNSGRF